MKLLVVEDDHKIANAIKKGFTQESFAVDVAYNGDDGLTEATHEIYDVIILDIMIPGDVDGVGILKDLRQNNNHTPVIFLTAKDKLDDRVQGLNAGADDYLVKPFAFEELLARVRALSRRPTEAKSVVLAYKDLKLNTTTFEVVRDSKPINLSSKEFALLEYLLRNENRIVSKDNIMQHVWNYDADILPNTVEVFIASLRKKVDAPFKGEAYIQTVRGFGYKLGDSNV